MSNETKYWLVSKPADVPPAKLDGYLDSGMWTSSKPASFSYELGQIAPGDRIALKSTANRRTGLPFFADEQPASTMTVYATGTVTETAPANGEVRVRWDTRTAPRDWFFLTYLKPLVRVDPSDEMRTQLVTFLFEDGEQDLSLFLADPYFANRFTHQPQFTWIGFYEAFASRLLDFKNDRAPLVQSLRKVAESQPLLHYVVNDQFASGPGPIEDIDPFTVMATFNRGVTWDNRRAIIRALADELGVKAPVPDDFDAVPVLNNQKSWFVTYAVNRQDSDIPNLWAVFAAGLALASDESEANHRVFCAAYDAALQVTGVKWNLTQGLYWSRPNDFVSLDGPSRRYLQQRFSLDDPVDGESYLKLRDGLQQRLANARNSVTSFPLLSYAAWLSAERKYPGHDVRGFATWAARFAESIDLVDEEDDYKRQTAALLRQAREQATAGIAGWQSTFHDGLKSTNTLDFRFIDDVHKAIDADPTQALEVLNLVWEDPTPASLDGFQDALRTLLGKVTPGNATGLGAWLLMSVDPESNAPYSPSRTSKWYELAGYPGPGSSASATVRYSTMLGFLDSLSAALRDDLHINFSRLETQGAAWVTTEHSVPTSWSKEDQQALRSWRASAQAAQRAWLVRPTNISAEDWTEGGYVSLPATNLGEVAAGASEKAVKGAVDAGYQHVDYSQRQSLTAEYYSFLTAMNVGDLVATQSGATLNIGTIESEPVYEEEADNRLQRAVSWQQVVDTDDLPASVAGLLDLQGSVVDITQGLGELTELLQPTPEIVEPPKELTFPAVSEEFANSLHMDVGSLQDIVGLLASRRQVVFYGPPGTGKTYVAMKLARYLVGPEDRSRVQLVQFHPSYAYEDFFEGFRPTETEKGDATFKLAPGPLRRIAKDAKANPDKPYILVIDELNRANLAKVFGELYFLLEYRQESIQLQYNPTEAFQLPPNLFLIGTMNTADRSIALLDAAMRRRFSFIELHPDEPPVRDVLARFLKTSGASDERARLLATLNAAIEEQDRDLRIGPSYLMREEADTEEGLARIWKYDLMPLLEEHYYGRLTRQQIHDKFGLAAIRRSVRGEQVVPSEDELLEDLDLESSE